MNRNPTTPWRVNITSTRPTHELIDTVGEAIGKALWLLAAALLGAFVAHATAITDNPKIGATPVGGLHCQEDEAIVLTPAAVVCTNIEELLDTRPNP